MKKSPKIFNQKKYRWGWHKVSCVHKHKSDTSRKTHIYEGKKSKSKNIRIDNLVLFSEQ